MGIHLGLAGDYEVFMYYINCAGEICLGLQYLPNNMRRGRGRLKLTWGAIKRDLKACDIPRDLCLNRSTWKAAIEVAEP